MDNPDRMDKGGLRDREMVEAALNHLRERGFQVSTDWRSKSTFGTNSGPRVRLSYAGHDAHYATTLRHGIGRENVGAFIEAIRGEEPDALLIADYVSPPLGESLRLGGVQFLDAAGNANLKRPPLLIWVTGMKRRAETQVLHRSTGRAFQSAGIRVVFALLCRPEWIRLPYRELARRTGVAHGSVGEIVTELRALGFAAVVGGQRRLLQRGRLQLRWAEAYTRVLRRTLWLGRYRASDLNRLVDPALATKGFLIGGELAAAQLVSNLKPGSAVVYGDAPTASLLGTWRLTTDPEGNVEFKKKFWDFEDADERFTPAPLIHADLLVSGDQRSTDAAREIHECIEAGSL
jgi:hypothetical protein